MKLPIASVILALTIVGLSQSASGAIIITNPANITLANSQVEAGGDTSDNPNVVNGAVGPLLAYTASSSSGLCCGATYDLTNLSDGDVGTGVPSDGFYALPNSNGILTLNFGSMQLVDSIAIYNGYGNRDDGPYTLLDGMSNVLGAYTISGTGGGTNAGVDSFWLKFNTPVFTSALQLQLGAIENSASFREIQVFQAVPEPSSWALWLAVALSGAILTMFRARRTVGR